MVEMKAVERGEVETSAKCQTKTTQVALRDSLAGDGVVTPGAIAGNVRLVRDAWDGVGQVAGGVGGGFAGPAATTEVATITISAVETTGTSPRNVSFPYHSHAEGILVEDSYKSIFFHNCILRLLERWKVT